MVDFINDYTNAHVLSLYLWFIIMLIIKGFKTWTLLTWGLIHQRLGYSNERNLNFKLLNCISIRPVRAQFYSKWYEPYHMVISYGPYDIFLKVNRTEINNNVKRFNLTKILKSRNVETLVEPHVVDWNWRWSHCSDLFPMSDLFSYSNWYLMN